MEQDLEISRFCIQFGDDLLPENSCFLNFSANFSQKQSIETIDKLTSNSSGQIPINNALVLEIGANSPEKAQELVQIIQSLAKKNEDDDNEKKYGEEGAETYESMANFIEELKLTIKPVIHSKDSKIVIVSIQYDESKMKKMTDSLEAFFHSGLLDVSKDTGSSIEMNLCFAKFNELIKSLVKFSNISLSFFQKFKFEGIMRLNKILPQTLSKVFNNLDPKFNQSPIMMFTKYFKMIDIDLRFNSVDELPAAVQKKMLNPLKKCFTKINEDYSYSKNKFLKKLQSLISGQVTLSVNIKNFVTMQLNVQLPDFGGFLRSLEAQSFLQEKLKKDGDDDEDSD